MNVTLCNRGHPEYGVATIPLPIPNEEYAYCMELLEAMEIGSVTSHDCYVDQITDAPPSLDGTASPPRMRTTITSSLP